MPRGNTRPNPDPLSRAVSDVIRKTLQGKGMSGRKLSTQAGIGHSTGALLLKGTMSWTLTELEAVCAALDLTASSVVGEAETRVRRRGLHAVPGVPPTTETAANKRRPVAAAHMDREPGSTIGGEES